LFRFVTDREPLAAVQCAAVLRIPTKKAPRPAIDYLDDAHRPVLLTNRGRGVAVVQSVSHFEKAEEERVFMRAVVAGLSDLEEGRETSFAEAKARFGLK
jgi:prevent-host-death family protein